MKKIIATTTLACSLFSSFAAAYTVKPDGWYLKGAWENMASSTGYRHLFLNSTNPALGLGLGYKSGALRGEGKYVYQGQSRWSFNDFSANGYLDFDNSTPFSPYLGLGLHYVNLTNARWFQQTGFYTSGDLGVRAYLSNQFAADVAYQVDLSHFNEGGRLSLGLVYHF